MVLLILESIGTPELILIAVIALIVLGPRKLPQMAKTVAKTMAEFRNATNEFKTTWEREVAFEDELNKDIGAAQPATNTKLAENENFAGGREEAGAERDNDELSTPIIAPEIKELSSEDIARNFQIKEVVSEDSPKAAAAPADKIETSGTNKRDWL